MDNLYRRTQILDLLRADPAVTQATVSRDLEELGLVKTRTGYRVPEDAEAPAQVQPSLQVILKEFLRQVGQASNLVVLKTYPGNAHSVAAVLDGQNWPEIVGTVAGDDTVFVATPGARVAAQIRKRIQTLVAA